MKYSGYAFSETDAKLEAKETELSKKQRMKFYLDTSVFGGYWDEKFEEDTRAFFEYALESNAELIYSDVTEEELKGAPQRVRELEKELGVEGVRMKLIKINEEAEILARHYIEEGALTKKCEDDARHIALVSVYGGIRALVSWNFRHMVNFMRIEQYNHINFKLGYKNIDIRTPKEMLP